MNLFTVKTFLSLNLNKRAKPQRARIISDPVADRSTIINLAGSRHSTLRDSGHLWARNIYAHVSREPFERCQGSSSHVICTICRTKTRACGNQGNLILSRLNSSRRERCFHSN